MADILLLEPDYSNKYPPIGLMKLSYFHKYIHHDYVRFAKGKLPDAFKDKKWDRVYVTTLFTFEWEKTKVALEYALSVVKDSTQVYTGGILATLMPELISTNFPTIKNNMGLLDKKGTLGLDKEECVDRMTLDYSMLDDIKDEYVYPAHDAYFTYMTRGCGMKCAFCAVQTLEPEYYPHIEIKDIIADVDRQFGPKKDLLLMDNNVLRSPQFDQIVDEIIELGFGKGAKFKSPRSGKMVPRYVDFNQGLDAFLLTPHKAKRLGELNIKPARIAFDHIEDVDAYKQAIELCAKNGIDHMSNYLLYNGVDFTGKGHSYHADTPKDLYERMRISMELQEELTKKYKRKITVFSFPMRYIPLDDLKRGFVGVNWNKKYLRSLQRMLIPTQGKGVSSRSFFEADFGKNADEFVRFLAMPEEHLGWRGIFIPKKNETEKNVVRKKIWGENQKYISEWNKLYDALGDKKGSFIDIIADNTFAPEKLLSIQGDIEKKLYIHYLTKTGLFKAFGLDNDKIKKFVSEYIHDEFPLMYKRMIKSIASRRPQTQLLCNVVRVYRKTIVKDIIGELSLREKEVPYVISVLEKVQRQLKWEAFDLRLINYWYMFHTVGFLDDDKITEIICAIKNLDERKTRELLLKEFDSFKAAIIKNIVIDEVGITYIVNQIEVQLGEMYKQISLFELEND